MTNDIFQFIQMIFGKGKNLFSDAGFFSLTRGINERDIAALANKFCDRHHKVFKNFGREFSQALQAIFLEVHNYFLSCCP